MDAQRAKFEVEMKGSSMHSKVASCPGDLDDVTAEYVPRGMGHLLFGDSQEIRLAPRPQHPIRA